MPASVQDLLLAAQARKSPLQGLVEGLTQGIGEGISPGYQKSLFELQMERAAAQRAAENDALLRSQINGQQENQTQNDLKGVTTPQKAASPGLRLEQITTDEKTGYLRPQFKIDAPKPKSLAPKEYQDDQGVNRIGSYDANTGQLVRTPNDPLAPKPADFGEKQDQFWERQFGQIIKDNDPNNASSRTAVGMLGRVNANAQRAVVTLSKPKITNQEAGNVMADIASIYQNGSPTNFGMSHQNYQTAYGNIQNAIQSITGEPQDALPDEIKARLLQNLKDMQGTNRDLLSKNFAIIEAGRKRAISKYPDEWKNFKDAVIGSVGDNPGAGQGGGAPQPGAPVQIGRFKVMVGQ